MGEGWVLRDGPRAVTADDVAGVMSDAVAEGAATWLVSDAGRILTVVPNGTRAMVMLLDGEGDPGGHAVSPGAEGESDGFVLDNGQVDTYADADTVPLDDAVTIVRAVVATGRPPDDAPWQVDR